MIATRILSSILFLSFLLAPNARAQHFIFDASGTLSEDSTTPAKMTFGQAATFILDITTLTLPNSDQRVRFFIQTTYDNGTTWTDLQNITFTDADNATTPIKVEFVTPDLDGPGTMVSLTGTDPGAGIEIIETVPANTIWRLWGAYATLVTDATVANRRGNVLIDDGTNNGYRSASASVQTASNTESYTIGPHATVVTNHWIPTPPGMLMLAGWRIQTSTTLLKAGDNWSAPQLTIEAWADPEVSTDGTMGDNLKAYRPLGSEIRIKVTIAGAVDPTYAFQARGYFK